MRATMWRVRLNNIKKRLPSETTVQHYARLKELVDSGGLELNNREIYIAVWGDDSRSDDYIQRTGKILKDANELDGSLVINSETVDDVKIPVKATVELQLNGNQVSDRFVEMTEAESKDSEFLLTAHGYDVALWEVVSAKSSVWQTHCKGGATKTLYSSKITVKPISNGLDYKKIEKHFENFANTYKREDAIPVQYQHGEQMLAPCLFDIHFSKLASQDECGENYDYKIAKKRVINSVKEYIARLQGQQFEKVVFAIGNDYFNSEYNGCTVNSTPQDNDSRYSKMFNKGVETLVEMIDLFATIAPTEVILVQGNHSGYSEFYAACVLKAWYKDSEFVTIDASPTTRKYIEFGKNLIGFAHGDSEKDRVYGLMQHEACEAWGRTKGGCREWLLGHLHSEGVVEKNGVVVRRIPTLCGGDAWHVKSGYTTSKKRTMAFVYDKESGLTQTHYVNI